MYAAIDSSSRFLTPLELRASTMLLCAIHTTAPPYCFAAAVKAVAASLSPSNVRLAATQRPSPSSRPASSVRLLLPPLPLPSP